MPDMMIRRLPMDLCIGPALPRRKVSGRKIRGMETNDPLGYYRE